MTEDIRSMRLRLSMEDMGVERTVGQIKKSFQTLKSEVSSSTKMFNYSEKSVESYKKHINSLDSAHKLAEKNLKDLKSAYHEEGEAQGYATKKALGLQKAIADQEKELHFLKRDLDKATAGLKEFEKAQAIDSSRFTKIGKSIQSMSTGLGTVSKKMVDVGTGLTNKITKPALVAGAAVGGITAKLGFDRLVGLDTAKAKLEGLGYSTKEVGSITDQVTNAIKGGMTTMAEGTDVAAGALASGVKEGKELEKYIKLVGDASVGAQVPVEEMAQIFSRIQGTGKLAGTELDMIEQRLPGFSQKMAKQLGVSYEEFREKVSAGEVTSKQFMDAIEEHAGGMAESYSKSFKGMWENSKAYIGMIGESLLSGVFEQSKGSLKEFEELLQSDAAQKWAKDTGVQLANAFSTIASAISGVVNWWNGLGSTTQKVLGGIIKWSALTLIAAGPMLTMFGKIGLTISKMFGPMSTLLLNLGKISGAMKTGSTFASAFASVFPKLGMVLGALTGPVGLTVLAITAIGTALVIAYKKSETFRNIVNGALQAVITGFKLLWSGVMTVLTPIGNALAAFGRQIAKTFGQFWAENGPQFMEALNNIKTGFMAVWTFIQPLISGIGSLFKTVFGGILSFIQFIMPAIQAIFSVGWALIKYIFVSTWQAIKGVVMGGLNIIMGLIKVFSGLFTGDFSKMWEGVKQIFFGAFQFIWNLVQLWFVGKIFGVFKLGLNLIKSIVRGSLGSVRGTFSGILTAIWGIVKRIFTSVWNFTRSIFTNIANFTRNIWNLIKLLVTNPVKGIKTIVTANFRLLSSVVRAIFSALSKVIGAIWRGIKNTVVAIAKGLYNIVRNRFQLLKDIVSKITRALGNALKATWNWIKNTVVNLVRNLYNTAKSIFSTMSKILRSITSGLSKAIRNTISGMRKAVVGTIRALYNTAKSIFTTMRKVLSNITQALKNAITGKWQALKKSVTNLVTGTKNAVANGFKAMYNKGVSWLNKLKEFISNAKAGFKKVATSLGKGVANGAISGLNAMIDGINSLSKKIMKKKLIKKSIPKLSTGTGVNPAVKTDSQGRLKRSTKAIVNDKGIGNAKGSNGHKELIYRRSGKIEQPRGNNKKVSLKRGDGVINGTQAKALRPHLSTGTGLKDKLFDTVASGAGKVKDTASKGYHKAKSGASSLIEGGKDLAGKAKAAFDKAIGDVKDYIKNPMKLIDKTLKFFGVDFSNVKGEAMGGTMSFGYNGLKNMIKDLVTGWFDELEGGDGDASWLLNGKHPILQTFGKYTGGLMFNGGNHYGIDFGMPTGTKIRALTDGTITQAGAVAGGGGNQITLKEPGGKWYQWYMHLSKILTKKGAKVKAGDLLGLSGNTGNSTTPHLHIQRMKGYPSNETAVNPMSWLKSLTGGGKKKPSAWRSTIQKAAKKMKVKLTKAEENGIIAQIARESNGDAGVTQSSALKDGNSGANLAQGLLQYVPSTFKAYAMKGHTNIKSGYDQLLAFFNNSSWRKNLPYGKSGWGPTGSRRFYTGGIINTDGTYRLADGGYPEAVMSLDPNRATETMKLINFVQSKIGTSDKKNKRPNQIPNRYANTSGNNNNTEVQLMQQQLQATQEQNNLLMQLLGVTKNIEQQPKGFNTDDVSHGLGKKARSKQFNYGM